MLEGKNKKEQVELKRNVCTSLNIREHTLREAIRRYRRRTSNIDSVLSIDTNNYNIKYDITIGDGSLDDSVKEEPLNFINVFL